MPRKSKKKPMDFKFELWTKLPNEMQTECIKRMDFITRMRLRATSKNEKELVESAPKYQFDIVFVDAPSSCESTIVCEKFNSPELTFARNPGERRASFLKRSHQLLVHILKFSSVKNLDITSDSSFQPSPDFAISKFLANISSSPPFNFKKVTFCCDKLEVVEFFIKNCVSAESIGFLKTDHLGSATKGFNDAELIEFLDLPVVNNVKTLQLIDFGAPMIPFKIIWKWLSTADLELGKTLQMYVYEAYDIMEFLAKKLRRQRKRVVSKSNETLRLRPNDSTKHILFRIFNEYDGYDDKSYCSFLVIPFNQKESEYERDEEWMREMEKMAECREQGVYRYFDENDFPYVEPQPYL